MKTKIKKLTVAEKEALAYKIYDDYSKSMNYEKIFKDVEKVIIAGWKVFKKTEDYAVLIKYDLLEHAVTKGSIPFFRGSIEDITWTQIVGWNNNEIKMHFGHYPGDLSIKLEPEITIHLCLNSTKKPFHIDIATITRAITMVQLDGGKEVSDIIKEVKKELKL